MARQVLRDSVNTSRGAHAERTQLEAEGVPDSIFSNCRDKVAVGLRSTLRALDSVHLCSLYETRQECASLLKTFLEVGIARREKCLCVVSESSRPSTSAVVHDAGTRIQKAVASGDIEFTTIELAYLEGQVFLAERAINFWREAGEQAAREGFAGLRAVVQLQRPLRPETHMRWIEYENRLTQEVAARGTTILCLYNRAAQPAEFVREAFRAHSIAAHRGAIGENAFHVPPEEHNASDRATRETNRMLASNRNRWSREMPSYEQSRRLQKKLDRRLTKVMATVTASADAIRALAADSKRHKRQEQQLRRSMEYLMAGQRLTHTGSWAWNRTSGQLFWSLEHFRIFGLDPADTRITSEAFFKAVHPQERAEVAREFEAALDAGDDFHREFRIVRPDGSIRYIRSRAHPVLGESGTITEYVGTVEDMTEHWQQGQSLESIEIGVVQSSHAGTMAQLMGAIAHEVNQPLAALVINAGAALGWLRATRPRLDKIRQALSRIIKDGNRASNVIARIRALLTRGDAERVPLSLNSVIQEVIAKIRPELRQNRVMLRTKLEKHLPPISGDRIQIQQVLLNLIMNAIEAMSSVMTRPRLLVVSTLADAAGVSVSVDDCGVGLDGQVLKHIFEPFYTTKRHGMGIGLAISRSIIEAHGGRLWAERKRVHGSTFKLRLPLERN